MIINNPQTTIIKLLSIVLFEYCMVNLEKKASNFEKQVDEQLEKTMARLKKV